MINLILIAIGLSLDTFALCIVAGSISKKRLSLAVKCGIIFGLFHVLNIGVGWIIGSQIQRIVGDIDHWIAFFLLVAVGINFILSSSKSKKHSSFSDFNSIRTLFVCAVATSIDALIVGISFSFINMSPFVSMTTVGIIVASVSFVGVFIGRSLGILWGKRAEVMGGLILIGLGAKILLEHLLLK